MKWIFQTMELRAVAHIKNQTSSWFVFIAAYTHGFILKNKSPLFSSFFFFFFFLFFFSCWNMISPDRIYEAVASQQPADQHTSQVNGPSCLFL